MPNRHRTVNEYVRKDLGVEIHQLRYFLAVADRGGMREAARACHVTQPSLSKQVQKLEQELGQRLFERSRQGASLTDAGRALLPRARALLGELSTTLDAVRAEVKLGTGRLAIGAIPTMAPYLLPKLIRRVTRRHPRGDIHFHEDLTDRLLAAVVDCSLDFAVVSTPIDHERIELEVIGAEPLLVAVPTDHPLTAQGRASLASLRAEPAVVLDELHCLGQQVAGFCRVHQVGGNVTCRSSQLTTVLELVRLGLGLSLIPKMAARGPGLAFVEVKDKPPTRQIAIAWRRGHPRSHLAQSAAMMLQSVVG